MYLLPSLERDVDAVELDIVRGGDASGTIVYILALDTVALLPVAALRRLLPQRRERMGWGRYQGTPARSEHQHGVSKDSDLTW